jgi:hypothetical protein
MKNLRWLLVLIPAVLAIWILWSSSEMSRGQGALLFILGIIVADGVRSAKDSLPVDHPLFEWDEMDAGQRLSFYMPLIAVLSINLVFALVAVGILFSPPGWMLILLVLGGLSGGALTLRYIRSATFN